MKTKICSKCGIKKDVLDFSKDRSQKDGVRSQCKKCTMLSRKKFKETIKEYKKQYHQNNREKIIKRMKQYREENKENRKQYYEKNKEKIKQYREKNKENTAEYNKQYREKNKDKMAEYGKQYREENKEKRAEYYKQYSEENKDKIAMWQKQYNEENKENLVAKMKQYREDNRIKIKLQSGIYYQKNKEYIKERAIQYRKTENHKMGKIRSENKRRWLKQQTNNGSIPMVIRHPYTKDMRDLLKRQNYKCYLCGCDITKEKHWDHWVPISKGGPDTLENGVWLCPGCNMKKHNTIPKEHLASWLHQE